MNKITNDDELFDFIESSKNKEVITCVEECRDGEMQKIKLFSTQFDYSEAELLGLLIMYITQKDKWVLVVP